MGLFDKHFTNTVKFNYVKGDIFKTSNISLLDAIIVFIPCGLTSIRLETDKFIKHLDEPIKQDGEFFLYKNKPNNKSPQSKIEYALINRNTSHQIYSKKDMVLLVEYTLKEMSKLGVKRIGMNGVRGYGSGGIPEQQLIEEVQYWLNKNENNFEKIHFIDLRGGFLGPKQIRFILNNYIEDEQLCVRETGQSSSSIKAMFQNIAASYGFNKFSTGAKLYTELADEYREQNKIFGKTMTKKSFCLRFGVI
jgi:hypothetical protein